MTSIEERIVQLGFNNSQFEKGASQSLKTLDKLDSGLKMRDGLSGLEGIESALSKIANRFSVAGIIGDQVIRRITNGIMGIVDSFGRMAKSMSFDQINAGWNKYADKTSAVQTIMSATSSDVGEKFANQAEQMEYVSDQLAKLNWFTDETSYSFLDMVNNIGKFTSNGIALDSAVTEMQGISSWAALSGANIGEASRAMYNLSQALAVGSVKLMDWKSIENANMATKEFKETALETAVEVGTLTKTVDKAGNVMYKTKGGKEFTSTQFNTTLAEGWFDKTVLEKTLKKYGEFSTKLGDAVSELNDLGVDVTATSMLKALEDYREGKEIASELVPYVQELAKAEYDLGERAFRAAQEAKTFRDAIDATKDAVSTAWMNIFETIFGNYLQAKKFWTDMANSLYNIFAGPLEGLSDVIQVAFGDKKNESIIDFNKHLKMGGKSLTDFRAALTANGVDINALVEEYGSFNKALEAGAISSNDMKLAINKLLHEASSPEEINALLEMLEDTDGWLKRIADDASTETTGREYFTSGIINALDTISAAMGRVGEAFEEVFGDAETRGEAIKGLLQTFYDFTESLELNNYQAYRVHSILVSLFSAIKNVGIAIGKVLGPALRFTIKAVGKVIGAIDHLVLTLKLIGVFKRFGKAFKNIFEGLLAPLRVVGTAISDFFKKFSEEHGLKIFHGITRNINQFSEGFLKASEAFKDFMTNGNRLEKLGNAFSFFGNVVNFVWTALTNCISKINEFGSKVIDYFRNLDIFSAITDVFGKATAWISDAFGKLRDKMQNPFGEDGVDIIGILNKLLLAFIGFKAVKGVSNVIKDVLGSFSFINKIKDSIENLPETLTKIGDFFKNFKENIFGGGGKESVAGDIMKVAIAIGILALSMALLASIDAVSLGIAITAVAAGLGAILGSLKLLDSITASYETKNFIKIAAAILILAVALKIMSGMSLTGLAVGVGGLIAAFGVMLGFLYGMDRLKISTAKINGVLTMAIAMVILAAAMKILGSMSWNSLAKGLIGVAIGIGVMAGALVLVGKFSKSGEMLAAGAAMLAIATAILILSASVAIFGKMKPETMAQGMIAVFTALSIMVVALLLLGNFVSSGKVLAAGLALVLLAGAMLIVAVAINVLSMAMKDPTALITFIAVIAVMAVVLVALSMVAPEALIAAAAMLVLGLALTVGAVGLVVLAIALMMFNKVKVSPDYLLTLALALAVLGVAGVIFGLGGIGFILGGAGLLIVAIALKALEKVKAGKAALQLLALSGALIVIGLAGVIFGLGGIGLILGGAGLLLIGMALNAMKGVPIAKIALQLAVLSPVLMLLGIAGIIFGLGGVGLLLGGLGLISLAQGLSAMQGTEIDGGKFAEVAAGLMLIGIAGILLIPGSIGLLLGSVGLMALGKALPTLSEGLQTMESLSWETIAIAFAALVACSVALMALELATLHDGTVALTNLANAMPLITSGLSSMESINAEAMETSFKALGNCILVLLGLEFATLRDGTEALSNLANAMPEIAAGLGAMSNLDAASMETAFGAIKRSVGSLFKLQFATFSDGTAQLKSLAEAMPGIAKGLNELSVLDADGIKTSFDALKKSVNTLLKLEFADSANTTALLTGLGTAFPVFAAGVTTLVSLDADSLSITFESVAASVNLLSGIDSTNLLVTIAALTSFGAAVINISAGLRGIPENGGEKLAQALNIGDIDLGAGIAESLNAISTSIEATSAAVVSLGTAIIRNLATGILSGANNITSAMATISSRIKNSASNISTSMPSYGKQIARGIANGLYSSTGIVVAAMYDMAYRMKEELKRVWGINSPSRVAAEIAHGIPEGIVKGLDAGTPMAKDALDDMADDIISSLAPALSVLDDMINDEVNIEPSIHPVVDSTSLSDALYSGGFTPFGINSTVSHRLDDITSEAISNNQNYTNDLQQLIAINRELLESSKAGGSVYLNDGVIAGMVNRRLGVL